VLAGREKSSVLLVAAALPLHADSPCTPYAMSQLVPFKFHAKNRETLHLVGLAQTLTLWPTDFQTHPKQSEERFG
jgi:hypothetical protein